jgi:transcriptional regulator with XRE-family HTH domain
MGQLKNSKLLKNIAIVLKQLRDNVDLTQDEVYDETKIHVGRIETAKANLTVSTLAALCEYYKISLSEFYKRVEELESHYSISRKTSTK